MDGLLEWLGNVLRRLRGAAAVSCGPAGHFELGAARGTQEIRPGRGSTMAVVARRQLDFVASPALERFLSEAPTEGGLPEPGDVASPHAFLLDIGTGTDSLELAFSRALALELRVHGRATIGNFGVWTLGRKPTLDVYVRFRAHVATQAFF
ncbi:MAG: hypothetical protein IV100_27335 [Myxococcales bacterium]|nr:hypothetical protein [Myxococcales bacterium]